ncbi:P-loop containing nucleoside triphosphate hydrolase protein [Fennellomyces sp. T-0311]|nr:P-loop containing nucleoside triphosphate hydrolase protein [Fennellomyces sp. T-0311]
MSNFFDSTSRDKGKGKLQTPTTTTEENDHLPWVEKYRPKSLTDIVSQKDVTTTVEKFIESGQVPHLLFYGPPGTGKTSTILACARQLYKEHFRSMTLELNASDDRGIDVVREQIKNFASTRTIFKKGFKLIILDEADAMTSQAQSALRRVIEKYTKNVRFCIICNYVSKIIPAIQSRCTRFRFAPLGASQVKDRLETVVRAENVKMTDGGERALLRLCKGDMRRALNILQACHSGYERVDESSVYICTGHPHPQVIENVVNWLWKEEYTSAYSNIDKIQRETGIALVDILSEVYEYLLKIDYPDQTRIFLLENLAEIEYRLGEGANESIQLGALVGVFKLAIRLGVA